MISIDHLQGTPAILTVPILQPCLRAEQIHITVDTHTGMLRCHVPKHLDCQIIPELQNALNTDLNRVQLLVSELRFWITMRRCEKTLQHLPATPFDRLPLLIPVDHPISKIRHKIFIKFHRHLNIIMVSWILFCNFALNSNTIFPFVHRLLKSKTKKVLSQKWNINFI